MALAQPRTWVRGSLLTRDGEDALSLLVLTRGHVLVRISTELGDRVALAVLGPGDVLGEVGLLSSRRARTADVEALETVSALALHHEDFDRVRRQNPVVDDFVMELMAQRIDRLSHRVAEAYHVPVQQRVARRLHEVGRLYAVGPGPVQVPLTQQDIAGLAGATRPTVNAVLRSLERDGVIRLARGRTELLDLAELRRHCVPPDVRGGGGAGPAGSAV